MSVESHFGRGVPWEETDLWTERSEKGYSDEEIVEYTNKIDKLYERIESGGYKSQTQLLAETPRMTRNQNNDAIHPALNEVAVNIFRDGKLRKKYSGNHRLAVARVAGIDEIPVQVRTRHREWQAIRDQIRAVDSYDELRPSVQKHLGHPDLEDIISEDKGERRCES